MKAVCCRRIKGTTASLHATCNANCYCTGKWNPVCHKGTGYTFYSACYAGCTDWVQNSSVSTTVVYTAYRIHNDIHFMKYVNLREHIGAVVFVSMNWYRMLWRYNIKIIICMKVFVKKNADMLNGYFLFYCFFR